MRWSPCERTRAPRSRAPPSTTRPSGSSRTRAPSAARPSARAAMRSLSLTRSSPAPVIVNGPSAQAAATARAGTSSISEGTRAGSTVVPRSLDEDATIEPTGSGSLASRRASTLAAHGPQHLDEGGAGGGEQDAVEAHLGVGQDEGRHHQEGRARGVAGHDDVRPAQARAAADGGGEARRARRVTPKAGSIRSVWSRLGAGSRTVVRALGLQAGEQDRRLHLRARDRQVVGRCRGGARRRSSSGACRRSSARWRPSRAAGRPRARAGRRRSDSSPVSTERNGRPARAPASMRIVDPEFSASRTAARRAPGVEAAARRSSTLGAVPARSRRRAPRRQARVEAQSAAEE